MTQAESVGADPRRGRQPCQHTIKRVAVIVAMQSELQHLPGLPELPVTNGDTSPWPSVTWSQAGLEITAVQCGIGMVRAAAASEATILAHHPDAILNFGCTGAHRDDINVGDVVIGTRSVSHTTMKISPDGSSLYDLHDGMEAPPPGQTGIASDPGLLAVARMATEGWSPEPWIGVAEEQPAPRVHEGIVASADIWTQAPNAIALLAERHMSLCEDMEAGAIATIAQLHGIPFLTIKDISNNELQQATVFDPDFERLFETEVGRRAATLVGRILDRVSSAQVGDSSG